MKKFLTAFALALSIAAGLSHSAQAAYEPSAAVIETNSSTTTCRGVQISTSIATSVIISTTSSYRYVSIQNNDATYQISCAERTNVSTAAASNLAGQFIGPGSPGQTAFFAIVPGQNWYCMSLGTSATWLTRCVGR